MLPPDKQIEILRKGAHEIIPLEELERKLKRSFESNQPRVVKQGFDPTVP